MPGTFSPVDAPCPGDALEFELVDLDTARAAHHQVPPGVGTLKPPEEVWETKRRKREVTDRALSGLAIDWVLSLPAPLRPHALCERYPRVANALAAVWNTREKRQKLLDDLVFDRRGNRTGFPEPVRLELEALHQSSAASDPGEA